LHALAILSPFAALLGFVIACVSFWTFAKTRSETKKLSRLPTSDLVRGIESYVSRYRLHLENLPLESKRALVSREMHRRSRRQLATFVLGSSLFAVSSIFTVARAVATHSYPEPQAWSFPAEPPHPTTFTQVPDKLIRRPATRTLAGFAYRLQAALADAGYVGVTYLPFLDDGFAVITPIEGITSDRRPRSDAGRWAVKSPPLFSLHDYLEALFHARHGLYRVWVFTVTTHPYRFGPEESTPQRLNALYGAGTTGLPPEIEEKPFLDRYHCFALAYEFERLEQPPKPVFVTASAVLADKQLLASGIVGALSR
jgi:hypothetical protein